MIDLNSIEWDYDIFSVWSIKAEADGYRISVYFDENISRWVLVVRNLENHDQSATSEIAPTWPLLDKLFGREHWQSFFEMVVAHREAVQCENFYAVVVDKDNDRAAILKKGRPDNNHGLASDADLFYCIKTYDDAKFCLVEDCGFDIELVSGSEWVDIYRLV